MFYGAQQLSLELGLLINISKENAESLKSFEQKIKKTG